MVGKIKQNPALFMILATLVLGLQSVSGKIALDDLPTFFFTGVRYFVVGLVFWLLAIYKDEKFSYSKSGVRKFVLLTILQIITGLSWFYALTLTDPINSSIAFLLTPILVYVGSVVFLKEPNSPKALSGSLIAMVGGFMLIGAPSVGGDSEQLVGNALLLLSAASLAGLILLTKQMFAHYSLNYLLGIRMFITGIIGLLIALIFEDLSVLGAVSGIAWGALFFNTVIAGIFALTVYYTALQHMRAEDSASLFYIDPLVGSIGAALILGNTLSMASLVASSVIVLGVLVAHPVHIHRTMFYHKQNISKFEELVNWLKDKYQDIEKIISKLF